MIATNNKFGADALSVHVNLGSATEAEMAARPWEDIQPLSEWGLPLLAMMYSARLFITCDSGPMHLACAVGSRTVAILQSPSFDHWGPPEDGVWVYEPRGASAEEVLKVCLAKIRSTTSSWGDSLETRGDGFFKPSLTA